MINTYQFELSLSRTYFHSSKGVRAIEVRLYLSFFEILRWTLIFYDLILNKDSVCLLRQAVAYLETTIEDPAYLATLMSVHRTSFPFSETCNIIPAGIWRKNDVVLTSMRRDDVASTSIRRHLVPFSRWNDCNACIELKTYRLSMSSALMKLVQSYWWTNTNI